MARDLVEMKSDFDAEFRRFSLKRGKDINFSRFQQIVEQLHNLKDIQFVIFYTDPVGDLLPITNDDNFKKAMATTTLVRLTVQRKDENWSDLIGYSTLNRKKEKNGQAKILAQLPLTYHSPSKINKNNKATPLKIGMPEDFRQVSAIIDVDKLPEHYRRVRLLKHGSDRPLGFYIHSRPNLKVTPTGIERSPAFFISRLVAGGLAESTGLISVNDEIIEVNGIEVAGKTLDQVTDMMIANCFNLILTIKPANQRRHGSSSWNNSISVRSTNQRLSQMSVATSSSGASEPHADDDDMDEVRDHSVVPIGNRGSSYSGSDRMSSSSISPPKAEPAGKRKRPGKDVVPATKDLVDGVIASGRSAGSDQLFTL